MSTPCLVAVRVEPSVTELRTSDGDTRHELWAEEFSSVNLESLAERQRNVANSWPIPPRNRVGPYASALLRPNADK